MAEVNLLGAVNLALQRAMRDDENVIVLGEDVGVDGGVFRATDGLLQAFGSKRVLDTPLAETLIAGLAVGAAAQGMRPVAEIQFMGFIYSTLDQIINHASRLRTRTAADSPADGVTRALRRRRARTRTSFRERRGAFAHVPGLRVVIPSTPADAYWPAALGHPGSGSGGVSGAEASLPARCGSSG